MCCVITGFMILILSTPIILQQNLCWKNSLYSAGVKLKEISEDVFCLHATAEKALLDFTHIKETKGEFKFTCGFHGANQPSEGIISVR